MLRLSLRRLPLRRSIRQFSVSGPNSNGYSLSEDQLMLQSMAESFSENELKPHASKWDAEHIFPHAAGGGGAGVRRRFCAGRRRRLWAWPGGRNGDFRGSGGGLHLHDRLPDDPQHVCVED